MRIGELATAARVSTRALRYYEEQQLLTSERSTSGQRHYSKDHGDGHRSALETVATAPDDTVPDGLIPHDILASTTPVAVYGYARAEDGRQGDLLREIRAVLGPAQEEVGCEQYAVHTTKGDPHAFAFHERWSCGADLLAHVSQSFMQKYFAAIAELVDGELEAHWFKPVSLRG